MMRTTIAALAAAWTVGAGAARAAEDYPGAVAERVLDGAKHLVAAPVHVVATPIAWAIDFERAGNHAVVGGVVGLLPMPAEVGMHLCLGVWRLVTFPIAIPGRRLEWRLFILGSRPLTGRGGEADPF